MLRSLEGGSEGDPRIADLIVQLANIEEVPRRLILGMDARSVSAADLRQAGLSFPIRLSSQPG
jgi:hypothetical protein